jgi:exodeoxyribonuclease VII large subunit
MHRRKLRYSPPGLPGAVPDGPRAAGVPGLKVLSVGELTRGIRRILESAFSGLAVRGEISGLSRPRSGHVYFTLRDDSSSLGAQISVVVWRDDALRVPFQIEEGLRVVVHGRLTVYEPRGVYQVVAQRVEPDGQGAIALAFERLKKLLSEEGLFAPERKRPLPFLPRAIGVVTSPTGAAIHDILRSIYRRHPRAWVRIVPVRVQGDGSAEEVAAAVDLLGRPEAGVEVLIVGRGGGSPEDLWTFNTERVVRAVAASRVPVISAVGHEVDFTLTDFAADVRAQTPTHAGELVVPDAFELAGRLEERSHRLRQALRRSAARAGERLEQLGSSRVLRDPRTLYLDRARRLDDLSKLLQKGLYNACLGWQHRLRVFSGKLEALNPLQVLKRGYAVVFSSRGKVVRSASTLEPGELLNILLGEGKLRARIESAEHHG